MNNDELQKAIDDITKDNNAALEEAPVVGVAAENDQLADELAQPAAPVAGSAPDLAPTTPDFGIAPAPEIPEAPGMPPMEVPEAPEAPVAAAPEVPEVPEVPEMPKAPETEPEPVAEPEVAAPAVEPEVAAGDGDTLNEALKELYPLLDKVEMPVEEKFDITMKFGTPAKALDLAKKIPDDTAKANALLEIVNKLK